MGTINTNRSQVWLLDGGLGTELQRAGHDTGLPLWSAKPMLDDPQVVVDVHRAYLEAGADIITANTFRTNPRAFEAAGLKVNDAAQATRLAIECARRALAEHGVATDLTHVAGSMSSVEDCYRPDLVPPLAELEREHSQMAEWLAAAGVDLVLVETMNSLDEAEVAVAAAVSVGLTVWVSFVCRNRHRLYSGEALRRAALTVEQAGAAAVGVNCVPLSWASSCLDALADLAVPRLLYPNAGLVSEDGGEWQFDAELTPQRYGLHGPGWVAKGAHIIGGCCGSRPSHIASLRRAVFGEL